MFRRNDNYISIAIWQKVFEMQNDWDDNIKDAANVLVQLCAKRDSIKHYNQMEIEKYDLKLSEIQNKLNISRAFRDGTMDQDQYNESEGGKDEEINTDSDGHHYANRDQSNADVQSQTSSDNNSSKDETDDEFYERYFYVDKYDNEQLKQLIRIFIIKVTVDSRSLLDKSKCTCSEIAFEAPSNLWTEKQNSGTDRDTKYNDESGRNIQLTDFIEDSLDANNDIWGSHGNGNNFYTNSNNANDNRVPELTTIPKDSHQESEYLIFERHFEPQPYTQSEEEKDNEVVAEPIEIGKEPIYDEDLNTEDLGIIDLEDDDVFDNIDDDKLPVLKNTYSKKNRPNNSKSVAAGSKSKANRIDFGWEDVGINPAQIPKSHESTPDKNEDIIDEDENNLKGDEVEVNEEQIKISGFDEEDQNAQDIQNEQANDDEHKDQTSDEEEDDINKYLDYVEDNDDSDDPTDKLEQAYKEKRDDQSKTNQESEVPKIDDFDICEEKALLDSIPAAPIEESKIMSGKTQRPSNPSGSRSKGVHISFTKDTLSNSKSATSERLKLKPTLFSEKEQKQIKMSSKHKMAVNSPNMAKKVKAVTPEIPSAQLENENASQQQPESDSK